MDIALTIFASYLIGSIPNAYLLLRAFDGRDLRIEGSRNIGARNAYEVSSNKAIGLGVLVLDMLKGVVPILFLLLEHRIDLLPYAFAAAVLGHCYPVWLRFHGGRGLATTAAIGFMLTPLLPSVWLLFYAITSVFSKNVHVKSVLATLGAAVTEMILYQDGFSGVFSIVHWSGQQQDLLHYSILAVVAIIISRHIEPVTEYLKTA